MTIAFGLNLGHYAIIAADTRTTYFVPGSPLYDDNSPKVQRTTMGLITGAGFCPILDAVKQRLAEETITHTDQIFTIINDERENTRQRWSNRREIETWLSSTGFIFTYRGEEPEGGTRLRVALIHPSISLEQHTVYPVGEPAIIFPTELTRDVTNEIFGMIRNSVRVPADQNQLESNIRDNSTVIASVITALQPYCPSISRRFQVGVQAESLTGISAITDIDDNGRFNFSINLTQP